jgi:hypothetical protein
MQTRDCVRIQMTNSDLDGRDGYLLGRSINGPVYIWIVRLDGDPYYTEDSEEYLAVTIPECCLEVI